MRDDLTYSAEEYAMALAWEDLGEEVREAYRTMARERS